jgi:hypothetical protein
MHFVFQRYWRFTPIEEHRDGEKTDVNNRAIALPIQNNRKPGVSSRFSFHSHMTLQNHAGIEEFTLR